MSVGIDEDFVAFRAAYPSVREAIVACENPIWIARIAFESVKDKKSIIRAAKWAARPPTGVDEEGLLEFISPFHDRLEVIDRWTGETTEEDEGSDGRMVNYLRAALLPLTIGLALMSLITDGELLTSVKHRALVGASIGVAVVVVGWFAMKRWFSWMLRVQVRRMDADKAFATVLARFAKGQKKYPDHLAGEVWYLRRKCLEVLDREAAFL
jgi:hypothetical protein